jgi:RHS repeat-associated protein
MAGEKIRMYYDPRGQVIRTVNPDDTEQRVLYGVPNSLAVSLGEVDNPSPWESYTYDANDLDTSCDHYATPKSAEVDALGRTIKTIDRLESSNSTSNNVVMKYAYDIRGNLLLVQDAYDRDVFEHKYDLRSPSKEGESIPPLRTIHINKGTSIVVFDCAGKPAETRDAKGALTLHAYDGMQRPQYMWGRDNADENVTMRQCSVYGNDNSNNSIGKIYEHYDESGYERINYYDFKGNVLQKIKQVIADTEILQTIKDSKDGGWVTVGCYRVDWTDLNTGILSSTEYQSDMEYDALNRIKKITYPADASSNRKELIPSYNRAGALHHVEFDGNEYVKDIAYNAKGQRLLIAYGNGLMTRYCYNSKTFRLTRLKTEGYTYSENDYEHTYSYNSGTTKQDFAYIYDKAGNILSVTDATPNSGVGGSGSLERDFSYDALYRLLTATGRENQGDVSYPYWEDTTRWDDPTKTTPYEQDYSYDLMGNITELYHHKSANNYTRSFVYHDNNNLLNSIDVGSNTFSFDYDDCGNQIQENSERLFEWDYADRMRLFYNQTSSGTEPSVYTHYLYDAGGNRVKKFTRTSGGNWQSTIYIDGIIEYTEDDSSNIGSISHIMDDSKRIATVREGYDFGDSTPAIKYNLDDHLGSSNVSVDDAGALVSFEEYYPFGETSFGSYGKKRYRFCGKEKDEESGLYYYGARYYSPWTCRFTSVDPKSLKYVHQSPFVYADNNPIGKIDHNGEGTGEGEPTKSQTKTPSQTQTTNVSPEVYTIKKGDTLSEIAQKKGVDMKFLADINNVKDLDNIKAGDKLVVFKNVPGATNKQAEKGAKQTQPQQASAQKMISASNLPKNQNTTFDANIEFKAGITQGANAEFKFSKALGFNITVDKSYVLGVEKTSSSNSKRLSESNGDRTIFGAGLGIGVFGVEYKLDANFEKGQVKSKEHVIGIGLFYIVGVELKYDSVGLKSATWGLDINPSIGFIYGGKTEIKYGSKYERTK